MDSEVQEGDKMIERFGFSDDAVRVLRIRWNALKASGSEVEFACFEDFLRWCRGKWDYGRQLTRNDPAGPWSAENCRWITRSKDQSTISNMREIAQKWDEIMEPIRKRYRSQLLAAKREEGVFRYEHPDLVREGIVFESSCSV
jgi:hypothetical protein